MGLLDCGYVEAYGIVRNNEGRPAQFLQGGTDGSVAISVSDGGVAVLIGVGTCLPSINVLDSYAVNRVELVQEPVGFYVEQVPRHVFPLQKRKFNICYECIQVRHNRSSELVHHIPPLVLFPLWHIDEARLALPPSPPKL